MEIRTVTVELLRAGPRHNQLLSPLTQYLGICGSNAAGVVTLPWEHREFEHALDELSYRVASEGDESRRHRLTRTGTQIAAVLGAVPGLSGALSPEDIEDDVLLNLRIVLSASELALLPFELSRMPSAVGQSAGSWLALGRPPVCITRHIRSVSAAGVPWPIRPRILFIAGPDVPFEQHRQALLDVIEPWAGPSDVDADGQQAEVLQILEHATRTGIEEACTAAAAEDRPFTHVHILAHGSPLSEVGRFGGIGVELHDEVIDGPRLALSLVAKGKEGFRRPAVVTLATCDSAKVSDVRTPDASVAHDLHDQGIPLVVASQFPLSQDGSVPFVRILYSGLLWGEHPLESLYEVRRQLFARCGNELHDWASLVAYEAFPADFAEQLEELRYWQTRRALDRALERLEGLVANGGERPATAEQQAYGERVEQVDVASARLPTRGAYALECAGLRAAASKRIALAAFQLATDSSSESTAGKALLEGCSKRLEACRAEYERSARALLGPSSEPLHKKANLHWLLGQVLSLDVVLGKELDRESWAVAVYAAGIDAEHPAPGDRAWAHVSLCELNLLRLADTSLTDSECGRFATTALGHARNIVELLGRSSEQATSTARQISRYVHWWGNPDLDWAYEVLGIAERSHWHRVNGLVPTAERLLEELQVAGRSSSAGAAGHGAAGDDSTGRADPSVGGGDPDQERDRPRREVSPQRSGAAAPSRTTIFDIEMLPAENGDCLWIEYGDPAAPGRVLIDCGAASAAGVVKERIERIGAPAERRLELFVLTHIDSDHISGVLPLFADRGLEVTFEDIWFNGWRQLEGFLSVNQAETFSDALGDPARRLPWNRATTSAGDAHPKPLVLKEGKALPAFTLSGGMRLTLLSPGSKQLVKLARQWRKVLEELRPEKLLGRKALPPEVTDFDTFDLEPLAAKRSAKDSSAANGSSIAFLAEFDGRAVLFTGDAHADVLASSIRTLLAERGEDGRLRLDAFKLSHHGSANALSKELLDVLDCPCYLVPTDGSQFHHPDREAIARIVLYGGEAPTLCFNYRSKFNQLWGNPILEQRYGYRTSYPEADATGLRVRL